VKRKIKARLNKVFGRSLLKVIEADNTYSYQDIKLIIPEGVFHPKYFTSSKLLVKFVEESDIQGKNILELGCGSGITSFIASTKGGIVTASDISELVIGNLRINQDKNGIQFQSVVSDLFDSIKENTFDLILINPPYYPKNPTSEKEHAWFCGIEFEYFKKLFKQLKERSISKGIFMTLSNECDLETIQNIAKDNRYHFEQIKINKNISEINYLFEIREI
jgi:release factor glutamine methyltransferase